MNKPKRRILNIIRRMRDKTDFYTNVSPRITRSEIREIEELLGTSLQIEHLYGASAGPIVVYPIDYDDFVIKAKTFLETSV